MKTAVDMERLAGAVIEFAIGNRTNCIGYVRRFTHTSLRQQTIGDALVISGRYARDHVGSNDARLNFKHRNVVRGEACSE